MRTGIAALLGILALAGPAAAEMPPDMPAICRVAENHVENSFELAQVRKALAANKLGIVVLGAGSSTLPGANGVATAYPARLQAALTRALPGVSVTVSTDVKAARTAAEMVRALRPALESAKPSLVIWQTGTVDAVRSVEPDQFNASLAKGIGIMRASGADAILMNMQYSPRTESLIALTNYAENMRWVALQHEIPLFDRFSVMKLWSELGTFDFDTSTKKLDIAEQVHDCIGRLLAYIIVEASRPAGTPPAENPVPPGIQ